MNKILLPLVLVSAVLLVCLQASAKRDVNTGYQTATVVSVNAYLPSNDESDVLVADAYVYDIGIRLGCDVYVGRYQSAIDYLPSVFAPNHEVDVRLEKHVLYVSLPSRDSEVKMGIVGHKHAKEQGCPVRG